MRGKRGARRAALLTPHLGPVGVIDADRLARQQADLLAREQLGQKQPAFVVEVVDLLPGELHGSYPRFFQPEPVVENNNPLARMERREIPVCPVSATAIPRLRAAIEGRRSGKAGG